MRHSGVVTAALTVGALACGGESPADSPLPSSSQNATVSAPSTLAATAVSPDEIDLAWQPGSTVVSGWQVHRSTSASGVFALVATLPPPMAIGPVALADGRTVPGFLCEPSALDDAEDITAAGGWRAHLAGRPE